MDGNTRRDGRVIEELGFYDPVCEDASRQVQLNRERLEYWLGVGAQPSSTVKDIIARGGAPAATTAPAAPVKAAAPAAPAETPAEASKPEA